MSQTFDAIVVGARCGGSPTAMLLARKGYRTLLVDRATFPSDTVSTHVIHAPGMAALARWGLAGRLAASGCPPIRTYRFDFGPFTISGSPRAIDGVDLAYCPRRTVLDTMLVQAAGESGVEVRQGFTVDEIVIDDGAVVGVRGRDAGGRSVTERAAVVIGADGRNSMVAKAVAPEEYHTKPAVGPAMYSYWSDVGSSGFEAVIRDGFGMAAFPTHDDLTLVILGLQPDAFDSARHDPDAALEQALGDAPELAERVHSGERQERFRMATELSAWFRRPFGPGWALVGDAGYHLHPITAQGITDAFLDAELLADALDAVFGGSRGFDEAMASYQQARDERVAAMYELTFEFAQLTLPPPEMQQLLGAVATSPSAMDDFASVQAGTLPIPEFFDPANVGRIMAAGALASGAGS